MRFLKDGPVIPDELLYERDQGRVIFLCGAGVSISSGMPDFRDLTKDVVNHFDPPSSSEIFKATRTLFDNPIKDALKTLDQIFHMLHLDYGRDVVNAYVAERLIIKNRSGGASA